MPIEGKGIQHAERGNQANHCQKNAHAVTIGVRLMGSSFRRLSVDKCHPYKLLTAPPDFAAPMSAVRKHQRKTYRQ